MRTGIRRIYGIRLGDPPEFLDMIIRRHLNAQFGAK